MQKLIAKYRRQGIKLTAQRLAILKFLEGNTNHPTPHQIFRAVRRKFPTISFATVYNTLNFLRRRGCVAEVPMAQQRMRYDPDTSLHHHIICNKCGKIDDVFKGYTCAVRVPARLRKGFRIKKIDMVFYGMCKRCQKKVRRSPNKGRRGRKRR